MHSRYISRKINQKYNNFTSNHSCFNKVKSKIDFLGELRTKIIEFRPEEDELFRFLKRLKKK